MKLLSSAFENNQLIPERYTCDGENISPELKIYDIPKNAKSLVLIMEDPDVPASIREDGVWDHWIVFNIMPNTHLIPEGKQPEGINGMGTSGNSGYLGPCPPDHRHRYFFKVFALDKQLDLPMGVNKMRVEHEIEGHVIAETQLIGHYERIAE